MGAWLEIPMIEYYMMKRLVNKRNTRINRDVQIRRCELFVNIDPADIANLDDVMEAPLWECEVPMSDDGF